MFVFSSIWLRWNIIMFHIGTLMFITTAILGNSERTHDEGSAHNGGLQMKNQIKSKIGRHGLPASCNRADTFTTTAPTDFIANQTNLVLTCKGKDSIQDCLQGYWTITQSGQCAACQWCSECQSCISATFNKDRIQIVKPDKEAFDKAIDLYKKRHADYRGGKMDEDQCFTFQCATKVQCGEYEAAVAGFHLEGSECLNLTSDTYMKPKRIVPGSAKNFQLQCKGLDRGTCLKGWWTIGTAGQCVACQWSDTRQVCTTRANDREKMIPVVPDADGFDNAITQYKKKRRSFNPGKGWYSEKCYTFQYATKIECGNNEWSLFNDYVNGSECEDDHAGQRTAVALGVWMPAILGILLQSRSDNYR